MVDATRECVVCAKRFHAFRHRHHCRRCHQIVCSDCLRTRRESVRVCAFCLHKAEQEQLLDTQHLEKIRQRAEQLLALELKHFGARPAYHTIRHRHGRSVSMDESIATADGQHVHERHQNVSIRSALGAGDVKPTLPQRGATRVAEAEQVCAMCLAAMDPGDAVFTTACGHSVHWLCLHQKLHSDPDPVEPPTCPVCCDVIHELLVATTQRCDHPRVSPEHRYCRDCGAAALANGRIASERGTGIVWPTQPSVFAIWWNHVPAAATVQRIALRGLHAIDYVAFVCVRLFLLAVRLIGRALAHALDIPWLARLELVVFACARVLFLCTLHALHLLHRLVLQCHRRRRRNRDYQHYFN